ncbi:bifunctional 3-(3-hydroxy-phenyl)propionate/3-hydroxycinnamic acid hydroxylase MhpA [Nocardia goodfellowii]|uniref:3-(3-hydroxy-phenyl)propionate hydroxylase n=1 Tax=Nocardia goodfellowii TaxID=882446 RepID=A0ABS4QES5_9NOCA|nr:bifunctional 3-(3-hydroxy-phenyl)propionate/3-hydroxycinnamic acid hydroxylase [Nocardia goodfellowii]MBP2190207.1 3-(3-hydroxy-phenyl)propionate hydroxylase [Nocardia goodfellowii]
MTTEHRQVVIVGTGPTGMTAASLLGRHDIDCLVLDRWDDIFPQPRAVHLDDEVHRIVADLGLTDEFSAISRPGAGLRLVDKTLRTIAEFRRDPNVKPHGFPPANMFDQPQFEAILRAHMLRYASVEFRGGCDVLDVSNTRDRVRVDYLDRDTGLRRAVTADYVLGCDGANSAVRAAIGSTMQELGFEQRWLVVDVATADDLHQWEGTHQVCDSARAATYMRIGDTRYRWEFRLHDDETAADFATLDALSPLLSPWLPAADTPDLQLLRTAEYTFRAQIVDRWRERRVFLLGDAAHLTPPFIGQGLGAGLRDAKNLVWKLAGVLQGVLDVNTLDTYETERKPHVRAMIGLAVTIGRAMTGGGPASDTLRRHLVPVLVRMPGFSATVTDSATPRLCRSTFVRRPALATRCLAGTLCPNAVLDTGGRLDDVAPDTFLIVSTVEASPGQRREITRRGGVIIEVAPTSALGRWLRRGRAAAAIVRPDRTVMATAGSLASLYTLLPTTIAPRPSLDTAGPDTASLSEPARQLADRSLP